MEKVEIFILLFLSSLIQRQAIHFYESFPSPGRGRRRKAKDRKKVSSPPKKAVAEYGAEISFSENKGKRFFATFFSQYLFSVISNVLLRVRCKAAEKNYAREFKRKGSTFYSCSRPSLSFVFPFHSILGPRVAKICFRLSILFPLLRRLQREQKKRRAVLGIENLQHKAAVPEEFHHGKWRGGGGVLVEKRVFEKGKSAQIEMIHKKENKWAFTSSPRWSI